MKKIKLYLDTSIINFALAEDIGDSDKKATLKLCQEINAGKYEAFISEIVVREIVRTKDDNRRKRLLDFIQGLNVHILPVNDDAQKIAEKYVEEKIIPAVYWDDALHIALTTINHIDVLVSWNFKHLVKHKTRHEVSGVNMLMGHQTIDICTPWEVMDDA